jgi:cytochrome P450
MVERPVVEFDHHRKEFHENRHAEWAALRGCPVAFNPAFGGFWVVSGYDAVAEVARDGETFSSEHARQSVDGIHYIGIAGVPRPPATPTLGIAEVEGPVHVALRRILNPFVAPTAIKRLEPLMDRIATWFLDQRIESGAMDLVADLTSPVPAILTMELVGLPLDGWHHYVELFHGATAYPPGSPEYEQAVANVPAMLAELQDESRARRHKPRDDVLTAIVDLRLDDGRALTDDEVGSVVWNLVGGGVDTTSSLTSLALYHLDEHRALRRQLIEHPELVVSATEEFLRFFSVNESLSRTVTRDVELCGQQLRRGDHVLLSLLSANRDAAQFVRPDEVILDRAPNPHLGLGAGPHRCIGMHMARTMFQVLLREVLSRIPDYEIDRAATQFYDRNPTLHGVVRLPAAFTPGTVVGPRDPPFGGRPDA